LTHLGLAFDANFFECENWAVEERETRPPGSPYAMPQTVWRQKARALQGGEAAPDDGAPDVGTWTPGPEPHNRSP
ncbi:MAG TPA: hypothetical protein VF459_03715, partial [Caulobacteraceae bacterium]